MTMKTIMTVFALFLCLTTAACGDGPSDAKISPEKTVSSDAAATAAAVAAEEKSRLTRVVTQKVVPGPLRDILTLPGETEPDEDVTVSAERGGKIEWMGVEEGDAVREGRLIAKVDEAALKADWDKAETTHALAVEQLARRGKLFDRGVLAKEELDKMAADVDKDEAELRKARSDYEQSFVRAPMNGVINARHVDQGEYIQAGAPVVDIVNAKKVRININVPEMDVRFLKKGDRADILVDAYPERQWQGVVEFVAVKADPATRTFRVRLALDNADGAVRPGMLARVSLLRKEILDAVTAPLFAIQDKGGERVVYVVEDGLARARTVKLGAMEKDRIQILDGLNPGDDLIIAGHDQVEDGAKVIRQ
jgi:membrane fusion protein, multidrug efflux system